jgi:hypothetical protein
MIETICDGELRHRETRLHLGRVVHRAAPASAEHSALIA